MSTNTRKAHILRALLEGIAFRTRDVIQVVQEQAKINIESLKVDGGLTNSSFLMRFQSNILQKSLLKTKITDSTSLGIAFAAGLTLGIWKSLEEISALIKLDSTLTPSNDFTAETANILYSKWQRAV
jgi:glycerol kinase